MTKKWTLSKETKEKMRLAKLGRKLSTETKERMSTAHKGKKHSKATKEKMKAVKKPITIIDPWS